MTSELEKLVFSGLSLNDQTTWSLEELTFTPAEKKPLWASNPNADGDELIREPHYTNAIFEAQLRVVPAASADAALETLGKLTDKMQLAQQTEGGVALEWTPANSSDTYTWYVILAEVVEQPITVESTIGKSPTLKVKFTARPFGYIEERTIKASTESAAEPLQTLYIKEVKGDVPAEGRIVITDKATQNRRHAEWGLETVASEAGNPSLLLTAANLTVTGFSGTSTTRAGAYSEEKVKRATAVGANTTMAGTGVIAHVGSYRVKGRFYCENKAVRVRISYRNGESALTTLDYKVPPVEGNYVEIDLGEVTFTKALTGTQKGEIRIEVKSATNVPYTVDLNYLMLIPTSKAWGRARGIATNTPNKLLAYDTFLQTAGNLDTPKALPLGGNWSEASKTGANGFVVNEGEHLVRRTALSDGALTTGCFAIAGTEEPTTSKATIAIKASGESSTDIYQRGVFLRYGSTEKWLMAYLKLNHEPFQAFKLVVAKREGAGAPTVLGETSSLSFPTIQYYVSLSAAADGTWQAWAYRTSLTAEPLPLLEGQDSVLATGGTLAKGKGGFYDAWNSASAMTRYYDNFTLLEGETPKAVVYSGKSAQVRSDVGYLAQDSTGTYAGPPMLYRGSNFQLQPDGGSGNVNRLAVALRRNDVEAETDSAVTDKQALEVVVRERFLAPR